MCRKEKLFMHIMLRHGDSNVSFSELCSLLTAIGFSSRIKGDHHIFWMNGIDEILNLQPKGFKAKSYQIKQVRTIFLKYNISLEN